jgi:hypothetical protein
MVALVIFVPAMVMHYKTGATQIDPKAVQQKLEQLQIPGLDQPGGGLPGFDITQPPKIQ